jgi:ketosteroid isomerase-like protein
VTTLQILYDAINRADLEAILSLQAEDVEWHGPQAFPDLTGPHCGHDGVRAYAGSITAAWQEFSVRAERFLELGDRVLVLTRELGRGRASGIEVQSRPTAHLWTLRDGCVVRFEVFWEREEGLRAAGLRTPRASPGRPSRSSCPGSPLSEVP